MELNRVEIGANRLTSGLMLAVVLVFFWLIVPRLFDAGGNLRTGFALLMSPFLLFALLQVVLLLRSFFSDEAQLIIDENGVWLFPNREGGVQVEWQDITGLETGKYFGMSYIAIQLRNPQAYLNRPKNKRLAGAFEGNMKSHGTPVVLDTAGYNRSHADILKLLQNHGKQS
jgi:hypothetical protein